jgi:hypothetical protein
MNAPQCSLITAFVSKTKDRFHEYNEDKTLEQRFEMVSRMADMTGVECIFPYETGRDPQAFKALLAKYRLQPAAINVNVKAEPEFRNGGLTSVDSGIRKKAVQFIKDAKDFAAAFSTQKDRLYRDVVVKVLTDADATRDEIMDGLDWIQRETTSKDVAAVFLSGHGVNDQNGIYYYLPQNADIEKLKRTCVPFSDIKNTVQGIAGKVLFFVDTCHSGNVMGGRKGAGPDMTAVVNELSSSENGAVVFSSSTGSQYSLEDGTWNNGAFTKAMVEGLSGKADYGGSGRITVNMLDLYISERVKELTGGKQTPTTMKPPSVPDFPVAVK